MKLRVRVQANRLVLAEAVATALEDVAGQPVIADTTDPTQVHRVPRPPHVVIVIGSRVDGSMSGAVGTARRRWRQALVIALAETDDLEDGVALVRLGADAWLWRNEGLDVLRSMVARIAAGERLLLPPEALASIASSLGRASEDRADPHRRLTSRERQVLECFARGLPRTEISRLLGISRATLRTHVQNILRKLELHSIEQAASLLRAEESANAPLTSPTESAV
jgi:DNA-binding NarL/FixJ family response regulator